MLELCTLINSNCFLIAADNVDIQLSRGMSRIFERSSDFKRGGSNYLIGGVQYISLTRTTNLAYLDAKE